MPKKKFIVRLNEAERDELEQVLCGGKHASRKVTRARILLKAAAGCSDQQIVEALGVGRVTAERVRERFVERGLDAINDGPRPGQKRIADQPTLKKEIAAWELDCNEEKATIDWRFSISDAREKLKRLYLSKPA